MLRPLDDVLQFPKRRHALRSVLVSEPSTQDLEKICSVLNTPRRPECSELRRLVKRWGDSGPNLKKMLYADEELWGDVQESWASVYLPTRTGRAHIALFPQHPTRGADPVLSEARLLFAALTLNPYCNRLGGPCARCGSYYVKKTIRQKVYCSQKCGCAATALRAVRDKRAEEYDQKLSLVEKAIARWAAGSRKQDWKRWVSQRTEISLNWLSRAINKGKAIPPELPHSRRASPS